MLVPKPEPTTVRAESISVGAHPQPQPTTGTDRLVASEMTTNVFISGNKTIPARVPGPPLSIPTVERSKNDKGKGGNTRHSGDEPRLSEAAAATTAAAITAKKKAKRKPEVDLNVMPVVEKLASQYGEINKKPKQTTSSGVHKVEPSTAL